MRPSMFLGRDEDDYENPDPDPERLTLPLLERERAFEETRAMRRVLARSLAEYEVIPACIDTDWE